MSLNRRIALAISIIFAFLFLMFAVIFTYRLPQGISFGIFDLAAQYHLELMFIMAALGVAVGAFIFYLLYEKLETREQESAITAEMLLGFLGNEDIKIISYLVKSNGSAYQSEISRLEGLTRLRAHRALAKLEHKRLVQLEKIGKTNKVILSSSLFSALSTKEARAHLETLKL